MRKIWKIVSKKIDYEKEKKLQQEPLEKKDLPAILLAAFITIFLPISLIVLSLGAVCLFLFGRL